MKFCPECDNILIPKRDSPSELYCKVCEKIFKLGNKSKPKEDYVISHKMKRPIIKTPLIAKRKKVTITEEDRRGFEDLMFEN